MSLLDCCGCRGTTKTTMQTRTDTQLDKSQCGIGVVFRMDDKGALVVDSLVQGGPAWESLSNGGLQVDDVLMTVDAKGVYRWPIAQIAPLLLGPEGSIVRLGVEKSLVVEIRRKRFNPPKTFPTEDTGSPIVDARRGLYSSRSTSNNPSPYSQVEFRRNNGVNTQKDSSFI